MTAGTGHIIRVVVAAHAGSVPRPTGTAMLVGPETVEGTIGGGALEHRAIEAARAMLAARQARRFDRIPLGPALGQCCGGSVQLLLERTTRAALDRMQQARHIHARPVTGNATEPPLGVRKLQRAMRAGDAPLRPVLLEGWFVEPMAPPETPLWIYGAGHVGRALVTVLAGLPFALTWVDTARERFPETLPEGVDMLVAANPARAVRHAPDDAHHLVLTYSHALDLDICAAVLARPFARLGLIGSATKRARFLKRLQAAGLDTGRLECPIGNPALGKEPMAIAVGVAAALLDNRATKNTKREVRA